MTARGSVLLVLLAVCSPHAAERWVSVRSGPFRVISDSGANPAKAKLAQLEQFRWLFGLVTGKDDPSLVWPVTVVIFKRPPKEAALTLARDARFAGIPESGQLPPTLLSSLTALFLNENLRRLPRTEEQGLIALFSTLESEGVHITVGAPPPDKDRPRGWALMQMLITDPNTQGEVHVFLSNLEQGADRETAFRNGFDLAAKAVDAKLDAYVKAGSFATAQISGKPLNPNRDFIPETLEPGEAALALADWMLASGATGARAAYQALHGPEADEGLGVVALAEGRKDEARKHFADAIAGGSKSARAYLEAGLLEADVAKKRADLHGAAELNTRWAEPWYRLALAQAVPADQVESLRKAVALVPRNTSYWRKLGEVATAAGDFQEAEKAWSGAALAAETDEERVQILKTREGLERQKADAVEAQRKREAEARAADLERVKNETMAAIHAAEAKANQALNPAGSAAVSNPVPWNSLDAEGPKAAGSLIRLDCRARFALLVVRMADGKIEKFLVADPSHLTISNGGATLGCGPQDPPRKVVVGFHPRADRKLGTIGEAQSVEFP